MPLKYSNARRSDRSTPSPSAYMRPSFHCAAMRPCSAAYSSETRALPLSPSLSARAPERNASNGVIGAAGAANAVGGGTGPCSDGVAGVASDGTGAVGRGNTAPGRAANAGATPAARGIEPGGRGTSTARLLADAGAIPDGTAACVAGVITSTDGRAVPSNPNAGANPDMSPSAAKMRMWLGVRITLRLGGAARMSDRAVDRGPDLLGV